MDNIQTRQLEVAIECLENYRTLVLDDKRIKTSGIFRLGKHAEDALNLMAAIRRKRKIMKTVRCKVQCKEITTHCEGSKSVKFIPVVGGSPENEEFYKWTPGGEFGFIHVNPNIDFEPGKEYYIDIIETI